MKNRPPAFNWRTFCSTIIILVGLLAQGCDKSASTSANSPELIAGSGAVRFGIQWPADAVMSNKATPSAIADEPIDCEASGVETVEADIYDGATRVGHGSWECVYHSGSITNIPAGPGRKISVSAMDDEKNVLFWGEHEGISIVAGQEVAVGPIAMHPVLTSAILSPSTDTTIYSGQSIHFQGSAAGAVGTPEFLWTFGNGSGIPDNQDQNPGALVFQYPGDYEITFRITDPASTPGQTLSTCMVHVVSNNWCMWRRDPQLTGFINIFGPQSIPAKQQSWAWSFVENTPSSLAMGANGDVYMWGGNNGLYRIRKNINGNYDNVSPEIIYTFSDLDSAPWVSVPAIAADGTIFVAADDGYIYSLNSSTVPASSNWSYPINSQGNGNPMIGKDGTIYISSEQVFYALDQTTGTPEWTYEATGPTLYNYSIGSDGILYLNQFNSIFALSITGDHANGFTPHLLWQTTEEWGLTSGPVINENTLYVGKGSGYGGALIALRTSDGSEIWRWTNPRSQGNAAACPAIYTNNSSTIVYVGTTDGYIHAIRDNGYSYSHLWEYQTGSVVDASPFVDGAGNVYIGSRDGYLYAINGSNGTLLWRQLLGSASASSFFRSPIIGLDGVIFTYVSGDSRKIWCLSN